jgi:hypothetical protein
MENLLVLAAIIGVFGLAGLGILLVIGGLLLCDLVFKTHTGRRFCRWLFSEE